MFLLLTIAGMPSLRPAVAVEEAPTDRSLNRICGRSASCDWRTGARHGQLAAAGRNQKGSS